MEATIIYKSFSIYSRVNVGFNKSFFRGKLLFEGHETIPTTTAENINKKKLSRKNMDFVKQEIFSIDGNTELEFLKRKTVIVIDKERFLICKQLMLENSSDEDFATFLDIPIEKVRHFKYKMQLFEDSIRVRRRAARLEKRRRKTLRAVPIRKREISSEERYRRARQLISKNMSTSQISKILKVSERSVTRFKRRMREEKQRLKAEGKIASDPNDPDDENSFRHLSPQEKIKTAKELFRKRLKIQEISEILKISER